MPRTRPTGDKHAIPASEAEANLNDYVEEKPKHAGGRPTKYDPAYCEMLVEFGSQGYSLGAFAGSIGVNRETVLDWAAKNPEFSDATTRAKAARLMSWEKIALSNAREGKGAPAMTQFALKNIDKDEWQDISRQERTGADGGPIETFGRIEIVVVDPKASE
jgi:hypothetical protein